VLLPLILHQLLLLRTSLFAVPNLLDHQLQLLLVLLELGLQILYVLVLVVDRALQPTHGQEELLHLEAQVVQSRLSLQSLPLLRVLQTSPLELLLVVSQLEAFFLELSNSLLKFFILPSDYGCAIALVPRQ
jgi:hypothetical protein